VNSQNVIGTNIVRLRAARKVSQSALAERAHVSRPALRKIEQGESLPRPDTLRAIAAALSVTSLDLATPVRELRSVRFRARKQMRERAQILAEVGNWLDDYGYLEQELDDSAEFVLAPLVGATSDPVELAGSVRKKLELGESPIHDICGLLESCGIKLLQIARATDAFFGLSVAPEDGGPAIVINTWDRIPVERWIFSAAHELGHLLLHEEAYDFEKEEEPREEENQADAFAAALLMPNKAFEREWQDASGHPFYERVLKVKRIFHVSYRTVLRRLLDLGVVDNRVYGVFQDQHRRRFKTTLKKTDEPEGLADQNFDARYAVMEPESLANVDFLDDRLAKMVRRAVETDAISLGRGAEILRISLDQMRVRAREWNV
jgi:Zn-dependent peptidase ImmA (M78 family)/transcriptional regulator with XRE-family HTH domain